MKCSPNLFSFRRRNEKEETERALRPEAGDREEEAEQEACFWSATQNTDKEDQDHQNINKTQTRSQTSVELHFISSIHFSNIILKPNDSEPQGNV